MTARLGRPFMGRSRHIGAFSILILVAVVAGGCRDIAQPEIHLLPQGFSGEVFILHHVADGEPLIREGWSRVYRVPPTGVLRSATDANPGWGMPRFFFVAADGSRERITVGWSTTLDDTPENRDDPEVGIYLRTRGTVFSRADRCPVLYEQYFVGTKRQVFARKDDGLGLLHTYLATHYGCLRGAAYLPKPGPGNDMGFSVEPGAEGGGTSDH